MTRDEIIGHCIENEEGGWKYTDHKDDPDAGTYAGVRYITYDRYMVHTFQIAHSPETFKSLALANDPELKKNIIAIYTEDFWDKLRLDEVPQYFQPMMFSAGVNRGTRNGVEYLQKTVNSKMQIAESAIGGNLTRLVTDGVIGQKTIDQARVWLQTNTSIDRQQNKILYFRHWMEEYNTLVVSNAMAWRDAAKGTNGGRHPHYFRAIFLQGWFNRAVKFLEVE